MLQTCTLFVLVLPVLSQNTARLSELTSKGIADLEQGRYNDAFNALEEVWEQDQSDPSVAENLAMAYLYADHDFEKARTIAERAIQTGGKASFLVQHPHDKLGIVSGDVADYCSGRLSISKNHLAFISKVENHSFTVEKGQLKEIKANRVYGSGRGMYHIRTIDKRNYNVRPRTWSDQEQELILLLVNEYLK
jgi:tetratricopeptide (TPR) repeat protein